MFTLSLSLSLSAARLRVRSLDLPRAKKTLKIFEEKTVGGWFSLCIYYKKIVSRMTFLSLSLCVG
jgi:hypothetical protein